VNSKYVLEVDAVHHAFRRDLVLKSISFCVEPGQIVCILGPSGCGKSTLLRIIAGLITPTAGRILIGGKNQDGIPTHKRDLGFVFQTTALFPNLNVFSNVAFPFRRGGRVIRGENWRDAVMKMLHSTDMQVHEHRSIATLSGGQLQRVALARALVYRPSLLLLDEPLSSLDNILKTQLLELLLKLHEDFDTSFLYVTHDEREALRIGTHVAIIDDSHELRQYGTVNEVMTQPATTKVAEIIGGWNIISTTIDTSDKAVLRFEEVTIDYPANYPLDIPNGASVKIGLPARVGQIVPSRDPQRPGYISLPVLIRRSLPWYDRWLYECVLRNSHGSTLQQLIGYGDSTEVLQAGSVAFVIFPKEDIHVFKPS